MNRSLTFLGLLVILSSACASTGAQTRPAADGEPVKAPPEAVKAAAAKGEPDPNQIICTFEKDTGSNIPEKVCRTRWQIEQERREAADYVDHPRSSGGGKGK